MGIKIDKKTYEELIAENLEWLKMLHNCLEKKHTMDILRDSARMYYEVEPKIAAQAKEIEQLKKENKICRWAAKQSILTLKNAKSYLHGYIDEQMISEINEIIADIEQALTKGD